MDGSIARCVVSVEAAEGRSQHTAAFDLGMAPAEGEDGDVECVDEDQ